MPRELKIKDYTVRLDEKLCLSFVLKIYIGDIYKNLYYVKTEGLKLVKKMSNRMVTALAFTLMFSLSNF